MRHVVVFLVLCIIVAADVACSRRSARAVRLPSLQDTTRDDRSPRIRGTDEMRKAIEALKNKVQQPSTPQGDDEKVGVVSQSGDASSAGTGVGTSGALSVETRYPAPQADSASQAPRRGHILSRAGDAVRRASSDPSIWVIALCALAAGLIVALLMRRSRHSV